MDVLVVGGGIAGLTAARFLALRGYGVAVADELCGGGRLMNIGAVSAWPDVNGSLSGPDLAGRCIESALDAGVDMLPTRIVGIEREVSWRAESIEGDRLEATVVILATGTIPDLALAPGSTEFAGRGFSECASCDGPLFTGQRVAATGTSPWLASEVEHLAELAAHVTVASSGSGDGWEASADRLATLANVDVIAGRVSCLVGGVEGLESILLESPDAAVQRIAARALFLCDGAMACVPSQMPGGVLYGPSGRIRTVDGVTTDLPGLFVAGDVREGSRPYLLCAAADGLSAALSADALLRGMAAANDPATS